MTISAGDLRHRVTIEKQIESVNSYGETVRSWQTVKAVWAAIKPLSAREFVQAQQVQSRVTARIVIRYLDNVRPSMRIRHGARVYNIEGVLADPDSGLEYLTLPVSLGVNDG